MYKVAWHAVLARTVLHATTHHTASESTRRLLVVGYQSRVGNSTFGKAYWQLLGRPSLGPARSRACRVQTGHDRTRTADPDGAGDRASSLILTGPTAQYTAVSQLGTAVYSRSSTCTVDIVYTGRCTVLYVARRSGSDSLARKPRHRQRGTHNGLGPLSRCAVHNPP